LAIIKNFSDWSMRKNRDFSLSSEQRGGEENCN